MAATRSGPGSPITERRDYLKQVLSPAVRDAAVPDLFERYGLDPREEDERVIAAQLEFALKLWRNTTDHEKYGELVRLLLKEHPAAELVLRNPAQRRAACDAILRTRQAGEQAGHQELEALIAELRTADGRLPESTRQRLIDAGRGLGVREADITARLGRERFVDDIGAGRRAIDADAYRGIVDRLGALRRAQHAGDVGPTLLSFLRAGFGAGPGELRERYAGAMGANDKRPFGDEKAMASRVLVDVRRYLVEADPDLYRHAVVADVKEGLRDRVRQRKQLHGRLDPPAFRSLVADAVRRGLDEQWATTAIRELALSERLPLDDAPPPPRSVPVPRPEPSRPPAPERPVRPPAPPRPVAPPRPSRAGLHVGASAALWFVPCFFPIVGPLISWQYAASRTGNRRYRRWARFYAVLVVLFIIGLSASSGSSSDSSSSAGSTFFALLWLFGPMVQALRRRREVAEAIATRGSAT
jgi:hypothetical protein